MTRSLGTSIENSFVAGFKTENSGLNFPENACVDVDNCIFTEMGEVRRRDAIDVETGYIWKSVHINSNYAVKTFIWTGAGENNSTTLVVNQIGSKLYIFEDNQSTPLSASPTYLIFNLDSFKVSGSPTTAYDYIQCSFGNGRLYIAHRYMDPFFLEYKSTPAKVLNYTKLNISIRDFKVFDDGLKNEDTPTAAQNNKEHMYNLYSQGWTTAEINTWLSLNGTYPGKCHIMWYFRRDDLGNGKGGYDYRPAYRKRFPFIGTTLAPRGKIVLNAFYQDRSAESGVAGLKVVSSGSERPTCVTFMNSRVFYGGVKSSGYGSTIYFSSIIKSSDSQIFFYQKNDPTAETAYELLPNDGGSIIIPEAENITAIKAVKNFLVVFCTNGVWTISGSEGIGFTATDYSVSKISDTPILDANTVILVDNTPLWWNNDGIYICDVGVGNSSVLSITKTTIQTYFNSIPNACKKHVVPIYNRLTAEVMWLFSSDENNPRVFDSILVFKTTTKAFYKHSITSYGSYQIKGFGSVQNRVSNNVYESVVDNSSVAITDTNGNVVTIEVESDTITSDAVFPIFLVYDTAKSRISFANFKSGITEDWLTFGNATSYVSSLDTGYRVRGDAMRKFQTPYITVYTRYASGSSLKMSGIWDYGALEAANRYTTEQEVCPNDSRYTVNSRRLRIRGTGLTLQLRFRSVGSAPFYLIGWAGQEIVNDRV